MDDYDKYDVLHNDGLMTTRVSRVNPRLVIARGISDEKLIKIKEGHLRRHLLFEEARDWRDKLKTDEKAVDNLRILVSLYEENEYMLQDLWGFPRDNSHHRWFEFPGCRCPVMDNEEHLGVKIAGRIISSECPIHWIKEMGHG